MAAIAWTGPALEDLRQIHQFIARDSKQYASIMVRRMRTAVSRLGHFPKRGRVVPEFPDLLLDPIARQLHLSLLALSEQCGLVPGRIKRNMRGRSITMSERRQRDQ